MDQKFPWRSARRDDHPAIIAMCLALHAEDPGPAAVPAAQIARTLETLSAEPWRGLAVVAEHARQVAGYALLVAFWSNEYGGEICVVDELYVAPEARGRGLATGLLEALAAGTPLWPRPSVAVGLEVTPGNAKARAFYRRLGFVGDNVVLHRARRTR